MRNIRRSQMIAPYGVGSIVNFPREEALMTCGLDVWRFSAQADVCPSEFLVQEERLAQRLDVSQFRLPPDYRRPSRGHQPGQGAKNVGLRIPFVRFPRWHYCRRCGDMQLLGLFGNQQRCKGQSFEGLSCAGEPEHKRPWMQPVRFVAVCPKYGHMQDFPFKEWAHLRQEAPRPDCRLRWRVTGATAGLAGITIRCSCGAHNTLNRITQQNALGEVDIKCAGHRPWLGQVDENAQVCDQPLQVVQRGGSNVYFAHIVSSIYLPIWAEKEDRQIIKLLENPGDWADLSGGLVNGKIDLFRCRILARSGGLGEDKAEELQAAAQHKLDGTATVAVGAKPISAYANPHEEEEHYRQPEYEALRTGRGVVDSDLCTILHDISPGGDYSAPIVGYFSKLVLVTKLRETRALYGFSRYRPDDERKVSEKIAELRLDPNLDWLPAAITRGEGIYFELDEARLADWLQTPGVGSRIVDLAGHFNETLQTRTGNTRTVTPKFVLLHTLAHLLINRLSFECGYGSASLRERIYCDAEFPDTKMSGFLIYTAAGDSEGTMGGLVRQGEPGRIEGVLKRALRQAAWCSYDPVCVESVGQGPDTSNLAACHGCAILPETSCEEGNKLLDRVLVAGKPGQPELGFFGAFVHGIMVG